ncbi:hypothetical protein [Staphylococcus sp. GDY8P126P]|uniref:hypothetical protein n=1 Tax=Staphylococcus sp. GDY8P126P TaxID=2804158 RepID=UPI001AEC0D2D|nr:hypothetical protein [Staphylococcus sp. GDY8P126P]
MNRAFRILTIYHRLLQNKGVNKKSPENLKQAQERYKKMISTISENSCTKAKYG